MRGWVELNPITCIARIAYSTAFLLLAISLPTCESSAYVVDPSKNANNIVNPDYIVSLTMNALHNTCREVVFMQQTSTHSCPRPSQREEESCHTTTDESSLRSTIIVLLNLSCYHVYVNE